MLRLYYIIIVKSKFPDSSVDFHTWNIHTNAKHILEELFRCGHEDIYLLGKHKFPHLD